MPVTKWKGSISFWWILIFEKMENICSIDKSTIINHKCHHIIIIFVNHFMLSEYKNQNVIFF